MANAAPAAATTEAPPQVVRGGGKKKLLLIVAAALLVLLLGGVALVYVLKKNAAAAAYDDEVEAHQPAAAAAAKAEARSGGDPPIFLPLEAFTVNLADKEAERYAQVGLTLEVDDNKSADQLKAYMPAIRNNILLLLSNKTSAELLSREGKHQLAAEIRRETLRPLGIAVPDDAADGQGEGAKKRRKTYPVKAVHFANLIVQ